MESKLSVSLKGFNDQNLANSVGHSLLSFYNQINEYIDVSRLELISVGYSEEDYNSLLSEFRSGLNSTNDSKALGAGMTVISDPINLKFRVFFNGIGIIGLIKKHYDKDESLLSSAIHTIIHEFMHVYVGTELYTSYPELLTTIPIKNLHDELKWKTILSCWDEYRVCSLCASFGENPKENYELILKNTLSEFDKNIKKAKSDTTDWGVLLIDVYKEIHDLLKYSAYYLGTCIGLDINYKETDFYIEYISHSWFDKYFNRLAQVLNEIDLNFEKKIYDLNNFSEISKILIEISLNYSVSVEVKSDNSVWVRLLH